MKKYLYSVTSKVICFILCIVSLVVTIACIWSSLYMQGNGFYDTNINVMIGREFSNYVKNDLKNKGKNKLVIWCLKENYPSRKFYEKMGGVIIGEHNTTFGGKDYPEVGFGYDL